jgi:single-stranded-DNA-specific exonuclease
MPKDWVIAPPAAGRDSLAMALRVSPIVAQVLCNRGVGEVDAARQFLRPQVSQIFPPESFPASLEAAERILKAVAAGKQIVIYGDYDVDGITGTSILWHMLTLVGAKPQFYIPHRVDEGYGINDKAIEQLARDGAQMIISVDCGVTAIAAAQLARKLGIELIITDHHSPQTNATGGIELPDALLVHPGIAPDGKPAYPNPHLSGAGVAFKLAWAIAQLASGTQKVTDKFRDFLVDAMGFAALGIVADIVPLLGENRLIAHHGLLGLPNSRLPGVVALIKSSGLAGKKIDGYDIGFKLAPRLNAIGRMGHARLAVELLTRADAAEALAIAANLEQQNRARQTLERRITTEAKQMVIDQNQHADGVRAIVLAAEGWHPGVIGIVASRITETFNRPTIMIALDNGMGQGSARSVRNFPLLEAIQHCREHLLTFGGHAMAAGLKINTSNVDGFRQAFQDRAAQMLTHGDTMPKLYLDDEVSLNHLDEALVSDLSKLEPFGAGNPPARLATDWLKLAAEPRTVGKGENHLQMVLTDGRLQCKAIAFGMADQKNRLLDHRRCKVAFRPIVNEWNGYRNVEMQIEDIQFPA